jgi:F0F1-type ATP synthase membrane subunit c/vacuolar-type H+-ATPase subunit K
METVPRDRLKNSLRTARLIGFAMVGSVLVYAVVAELIKLRIPGFRGFSPPPRMEMLRYLLLAVAIAEFFMIRFIRRVILSNPPRSFGDPSKGKASWPMVIQRLMTSTVISYVFCESIALFGLVLFLIGGRSSDFYLFLVLALLFFAIYFPKDSQWEDGAKSGAA